MITAIQRALAPLVGLPLWAANRAANMISFQFGVPVRAPTGRDPDRLVGEYALHLQCAWRLSATDGVITGASDIFVPAHDDADDSYRWDKPGASLVDVHLARWIAAHAGAPLCVASITVDRCGGFVLQLPREAAVEVFPDAGRASHNVREMWRLLQPGQDTPHFVYLNQRTQ